MSSIDFFDDKDVKAFLDSLGLPLENIYIESSPFGETIGYTLKDGREFDLAVESTEFESRLLAYLKAQGVKVKELSHFRHSDRSDNLG